MRRLSLFLLLFAQTGADAIAPRLEFAGPPELAATQARLEGIDTERMTDIVRLIGLSDPGAPIRVELAAENSPWSQAVSPSIAGFAMGSEDRIVIFPSRSPSYPDNTLDDVMRHEVAHVLIHRAASGRPIPRWFHEGLAMAVERRWNFGDQTQLFYQLVSGPRESFVDINRLFDGSPSDRNRAYLLSGALVRELMRRSEDVPRRILQEVRRGASFETAFFDVTGRTTTTAETEFWSSQRVWTTWIPVVFSDETLWMAVTVLAILAIRRHRRKNAEIQKRWEEEDSQQSP